jgi:tetratricopeptide (TPR) repeat protein
VNLLRVAARAAIDSGQFDHARTRLDRLIAIDDADPEIAPLSARLQFRTGDYEALGKLEASVRPTRAEDVELFATAASIRGERALAIAIYRRALDRASPADVPTLRAQLARLLVERGEGAEARAEIREARTGTLDVRVATSLETTQALNDHDEGRFETAIAAYDRVIARYAGMGNVLASYLRFVRAVATLEAGRHDEAVACALAALEDVPPEMAQLRPLVDLARFVALGQLPDAAVADGSVVASSSALVRAYVAQCRGTPLSETALRDLVRANQSHAAWSVLSRVLARLAQTARVASSTSLASKLLVGPGASWFVPPGGAQVSLEHRPVLVRVLAHLVVASESGPSARTTVDEIAAAAWPGERIVEHARRSRVHVAISTLRGMGLRTQLSHAPRGYRLDVAIARAAADGTF